MERFEHFILTILLSGALHITGSEQLCPPPPLVQDAAVEWSDRTLGAFVTYTCRKGFEMEGTSDVIVAYCTEGGEWNSSVKPNCRAIRCPPPQLPAFGNFSFLSGNGQYDSTILYQCDGSYHLDGAPAARCTADGTWSHDAPTCYIECSQPYAQLGDHACLEVSGRNASWPAAQQYCVDHGGSLMTVRDRTTQSELRALLTGIDGEDVITTRRYWIGASELQASHQQTDRSWLWVDGTIVEQSFWAPDEPTAAVDSDSRGECVELDPTTDFAWNDSPCNLRQRYICQFGDYGVCSDPGVPFHGSRTLLACNEFDEGCLISIRCDPGFRLKGQSSITCLITGEWSSSLPTCEPKRCPSVPPSPLQSYQQVEVSSTRYRSVAVLSCPADWHAVRGDAFIFCREDGAWSTPTLECKANGMQGTQATSTFFTEPDWTIIGTIGALSILLIIAIIVIIVLALVRRDEINTRRRSARRPVPAEKKRRSEDVTYYSIRNPRTSYPDIGIVPGSDGGGGGHVEMYRKVQGEHEVPDPGARARLPEPTCNNDGDNATNDDYLTPIRQDDVILVLGQEKIGKDSKTKTRAVKTMSSSSYNHVSLSSLGQGGDYVNVRDVDDDDNKSEDGLLNNYIILLPEDEPLKEEEGDGMGRKYGGEGGSNLETTVIPSIKVQGDEDERSTMTSEVKGQDEEQEGRSDLKPDDKGQNEKQDEMSNMTSEVVGQDDKEGERSNVTPPDKGQVKEQGDRSSVMSGVQVHTGEPKSETNTSSTNDKKTINGENIYVNKTTPKSEGLSVPSLNYNKMSFGSTVEL